MLKADPKLRQEAHKQGIVALREGRFAEAVDIFEAAIELHGSHVGLLSDLVGATYLNGEMALFEIQTDRLESEFEKASPYLTTKSRVLTAIALAKFQEERAKWADAFEWLERARNWIEPGDPLLLRIEMQCLRCLADLGRQPELIKSYDLCLGISERNPQLYIEAFHALALAEMRLFGFERAWARIKELNERSDLQAADLTLCLIDLLEIAVETKNSDAQKTIHQFIADNKLEARDEFEAAILNLSRVDFEPSASEIQKIMQKISPMARLRWMALGLRRFNDCIELRKAFVLKIQSLDHRSKNLLLKKWDDLIGTSQAVEIQIDENSQSLSYEGRRISLSKSPQTWKILKAIYLSGSTTSPVDLLTAVERNGGGATDLETLRIAVLRLNQKLNAFSPLEWHIKYRKDSVVLHPRLKLKLKDAA